MDESGDRRDDDAADGENGDANRAEENLHPKQGEHGDHGVKDRVDDEYPGDGLAGESATIVRILAH